MAHTDLEEVVDRMASVFTTDIEIRVAKPLAQRAERGARLVAAETQGPRRVETDQGGRVSQGFDQLGHDVLSDISEGS